jgi:3-vinyl bacteriochlorophyllide hydratase
MTNGRSPAIHAVARSGLYTPAERDRRDRSVWTLVQGILAPLQFLVFIISLGLVLRTLMTGDGLEAATISIIAKTMVLYTMSSASISLRPPSSGKTPSASS